MCLWGKHKLTQDSISTSHGSYAYENNIVVNVDHNPESEIWFMFCVYANYNGPIKKAVERNLNDSHVHITDVIIQIVTMALWIRW